MLPHRVTSAILAEELGAARAWAHQENVSLAADVPQRLIRAVFTREESGEKFFLLGKFDNYKEVPPSWQWCDVDWTNGGDKPLSPNAAQTPHGSSMFLDHKGTAVICAPFNRLAFSANAGPHKDWGELSNWMSAGHNFVYAATIADMLDVIARDFRHSSGRMA